MEPSRPWTPLGLHSREVATLIVMVALALATSARSEPLEYVHMQPARSVVADFDGDGAQDRASVMVSEVLDRVAVWVRLGNGREFPLEAYADTAQARSLRLDVVRGLDPSCPSVDRLGRPACNRRYWSRHEPSLRVHAPGDLGHLWFWNGSSFAREQVFR